MHQGPALYLIGGPNGAGKTTFAKEYLPNEVNCLRFYNSYEIAAGLSPLNPAAAQIQAARILLKNLGHSIAKRETFALESTLSGKTYAKYLAQAKKTASASSFISSGSPTPTSPGPVSKAGFEKAATPSPKTPSTVAFREYISTSSKPTSPSATTGFSGTLRNHLLKSLPKKEPMILWNSSNECLAETHCA